MIATKAEDVMAKYIADGEENLTEAERKLVDLKVFEKTGKHIARYKNKSKAKTKKVSMVISADGDKKGQKSPDNAKLRTRKDPKTSFDPAVNTREV